MIYLSMPGICAVNMTTCVRPRVIVCSRNTHNRALYSIRRSYLHWRLIEFGMRDLTAAIVRSAIRPPSRISSLNSANIHCCWSSFRGKLRRQRKISVHDNARRGATQSRSRMSQSVINGKVDRISALIVISVVH